MRDNPAISTTSLDRRSKRRSGTIRDESGGLSQMVVQMETIYTMTEQQQLKLQLVQDIGKLEGDLSRLESELRQAQEKVGSVKGQRTGGSVALLLSILGIFFLTFIWPLWAFLFVIGTLTIITAGIKGSNARDAVSEVEARMAETRSQLATLRAQLVIL